MLEKMDECNMCVLGTDLCEMEISSEHLPTVYIRTEAWASISFKRFLTRPPFEPSFYSSPASIKRTDS